MHDNKEEGSLFDDIPTELFGRDKIEYWTKTSTELISINARHSSKLFFNSSNAAFFFNLNLGSTFGNNILY